MKGNVLRVARRAASSVFLTLFFEVVMVHRPTAEAVAQAVRNAPERMTL